MKKILIIDDEVDICLLLKAYLQKKEFSVNYAVSLTEGFDVLQQCPPDVVILDNNLPDGLGIDSINEIKSDFPKTKLIMISAMNSLEQKALKQGVDHFIPKPFKLSLINQLLHQ